MGLMICLYVSLSTYLNISNGENSSLALHNPSKFHEKVNGHRFETDPISAGQASWMAMV